MDGADEIYLGLHKLTEECGELIQALSKLNAPSTKSLAQRHRDIEEEAADVFAALKYFVRKNDNVNLSAKRVKQKYNKFKRRGLPGIKPHTLQIMEIKRDTDSGNRD